MGIDYDCVRLRQGAVLRLRGSVLRGPVVEKLAVAQVVGGSQKAGLRQGLPGLFQRVALQPPDGGPGSPGTSPRGRLCPPPGRCRPCRGTGPGPGPPGPHSLGAGANGPTTGLLGESRIAPAMRIE